VFVYVILGLSYCFDSGEFYSVIKRGQDFTIVPGREVANSLAWGVYDDGVYSDGWGKLSLYTHSFQSEDEAYAAGYLEAALTATYILYHRNNLF
jgi:hypothetical protein